MMPAIQPLMTALNHKHKDMRQRAAEALDTTGVPAVGLLYPPRRTMIHILGQSQRLIL
jgi:hypothetical protein